MAIYRGCVYGFAWGFELGIGVVTIVTSATVYLVYGLAFLSGSWSYGLVIGATFGLSRGLVILDGAGVHTPDRLTAFHRRLQRGAPLARAATVGADAAVVVAAAVTLVR